MKQDTVQVWVRSSVIVALGVLIWATVYFLAALAASRGGLPFWPTVVTWTEWVVAVGMMPKFIALAALGMLSGRDVRNRVAQRVVNNVNTLTLALLVTFALDLVVRGVANLGWEPF